MFSLLIFFFFNFMPVNFDEAETEKLVHFAKTGKKILFFSFFKSLVQVIKSRDLATLSLFICKFHKTWCSVNHKYLVLLAELGPKVAHLDGVLTLAADLDGVTKTGWGGTKGCGDPEMDGAGEVSSCNENNRIHFKSGAGTGARSNTLIIHLCGQTVPKG